MEQEYKKIRMKILKGKFLTEQEKRYYLAHVEVFGLNFKSLRVHNKFLELQEKQRIQGIQNLPVGIKLNIPEE